MNPISPYLPLRTAAVLLATALLGFSPASAQVAPAPTHTFQPAGTTGVFGTNTNWSANTLPGTGSDVLIADGKTATTTQANVDTVFGSLTLGVNSTMNLAASGKQGINNFPVYFSNNSQLLFTSGDVNRSATYNVLAGATATFKPAGSNGDSIVNGAVNGHADSVFNVQLLNSNPIRTRWDTTGFLGTMNYQVSSGSQNVDLSNFAPTNGAVGPGVTNFATNVRATMAASDRMSDTATLQLTGSSGGASNVKFDMNTRTDTIGNFVIDSPTGATSSAPTLRGSNTLTVSGTTTFQGTAGDVNFDSNNATPSSHNLLTTGSMTFGGTGTWAVAGDGRINLNATGGTRIITTNATTSISNILVGTQGFTKAGASTLTLNGSAVNVITGGISLNAGTLTLDYANMATPTNLVASGNALTVRGGNLLLRGKNSGATSQTLGNVTVNAGGGTMLLNPNGGTSTGLVLGTLTATSQGSSLTVGTALGAGAGTATITTTTNKDAQDIYGGRVVFANGTANTGYEWATTVSGGAPYTLSAYGGYAAMAASGTDTANSRISANSTLAGSLTTNSLKIENPAASQSLDLDVNSLVLTSGGLLVTGTNAVQITGASGNVLTAGNGSGSYDLVIHQYNSGGLDIGAVIANNGGNATSLTKAGSGSLTLSGSNTFTGGLFINDGTVILAPANPGALNSTAGSENAVTIASSGALSLNGNSLVLSNLTSPNTTTDGGIVQNANAAAATLTVGNSANLSGTFAGVIQNGTGGGALSLAKTGTGKLTLTNANTFTGSTAVNTGVLNIQNAAALGATAGSTTVANGAALEIQGGITVGAEALSLDGSGISSGGALRNISGNNVWQGAVTLAGATTIQSDAGTLTFNTAATSITGTDQNLTIEGAGNVTISGATAGIATGSGTLTKNDAGTLTLSGPNSFTGATSIAGGVLNIQNATSLGTTAGGVTVSSGAALEIQGGITVGAEALGLNGTGISSNGALRNIGGNNVWQGALTLNGATTIQSDSGTLTFNTAATSITGTNQNLAIEGAGNVTISGATAGIATGSGTLTKRDAGTLTLSGPNSYTGVTALNGGTLRLENINAIGSSTSMSMATGTTLQLRSDSADTFNTPTIALPGGTSNSVTINVDRTSSGSGNLLTLSSGLTLLNNTTGATVTLNTTGGNGYSISIPSLSITTSGGNNGGTATTLNPSVNTTIGTLTSTANTTDLQLNLGGAAGTVNTINTLTTVRPGNFNPTGNKNTAATWIVNNWTQLGGAFTVSAGTLTITGTLNVSGMVGDSTRFFNVTGGTLNLNSVTALTNTNAGRFVMTGGTLDNTSGSAKILSSNPLTTWNGNFAFAGSLGAQSDLDLGTGGVTLGTAAGTTRTVTVTNANTTFTVGGIIANGTNANSLTKAGDGTLRLSGTSSTYTGVTTITAGTLSVATIGNGSAVGSLGQATNAATNIVFNGGTLLYTGANATSDRAFTINNGITATIETTNNISFAGATGAATNGALTKTGAGELTLTGVNTYTGLTTVSAGTLALGHATDTISGAVNVNGGTLALGTNTDTVGAVTLTTGSITGSGTSVQGVLTGTSYAVQSGSVSAKLAGSSVVLTKTTAGTVTLSAVNTYTGATNITGGILQIALGGSTHASSAVTVSNSGSALVVDGTVSGTLVANASTTVSGSGTVSGAATISGNLNPGSSPGVLSFGSSLGLDSNTDTTMEINGTTRGTNYDGINSGALTYGGDLVFSFGNIAAFTGGADFDLFSFTGSSLGDFATVTSTGFYVGNWSKTGDTWALTDQGQTLNFSEVTGNLVVVPEPSSALLTALGVLALLRRRR